MYRNLFGEEYRYKYHHIDLCKANTDGNKMAINNKFMALTWDYDRGGIAIFDPNEYSYGKPDQKLIKGHTGKIFDIKFSPFRTDLLASASDDCTVKLWQIPKEGLTQDLKTDSQTFLGHKRKVCLVDFNKHAADVIASASVDSTVQVWNMIKAETYATCQITGNPTSLEWNYNGSLIGATDSDKNINIFDPRANTVIMKHKVSDGRSAKFVWSGENTFAYVGINKKNEREFKNFDIRNTGENTELFQVKIDDKMAKWTVNNEIYYVSFYVMRRDPKYIPELFPHIPVSNPSMTFEEWKSGENKPLERKEICEFDKNEFITRDDKFEKKEVAKAEITPGEKYKNLEHKLIELEQGIQKLVGGNNILRKRIEDEEAEVEKLENMLKEVNAEIEA